MRRLRVVLVLVTLMTLFSFGFFHQMNSGDFSDLCKRQPHSSHSARPEFLVIHVGKTGGTSMVEALSRVFRFETDFHLCAPSMEDVKGRPVLMTIREPVARTLSIWRWRKYRCTVHDHCANTTEGKLFSCYPFLNDFLEVRNNLTTGLQTNNSIGEDCLQLAQSSLVATKHWQLDHRWYLHKFDEHFVKTHVFPIRQTNMVEDFVNFCQYFHFNKKKCNKAKKRLMMEHDNEEYPTSPKDFYLSEKATEFLTSELKDEIKMYNFLVALLHEKVDSLLQEKKDRSKRRLAFHNKSLTHSNYSHLVWGGEELSF